MILQALVRYYEILQKASDSDIAPLGYSKTGVSYALNLSEAGELLEVFPLFEPAQRGKKTVEAPRRMLVPEQVKRTVGISPNFLCDNAAYVLGLTDKAAKDPDYARKRFEAFRTLNTGLLRPVDSPVARAIVAFLDQHDPAAARQRPALAAQLTGLLEGGNLVFMLQGAFAHEDPLIRQAWELSRAGGQAVVGQCLVTGETAPVARLHASLKRIRGAQSIGATLVGFHARAYESYNREQGLNAPVSEKAVFAYTTALNYLLSTDNPHPPIVLGDTTVVYWAESEQPAYCDYFAQMFGAAYPESASTDQAGRKDAEQRLEAVAHKVQRGQALDADQLRAGLDENVRFYVLGLAPNAARVSVRFFIAEPFGKIVGRIQQHYADLQIVKEFENQKDYIPLRAILDETVSQKGQNPEPAPLLAGAVMRAILSGAPYPAALYDAVLIRIRADMDDSKKRIYKINYVRAAVVKACLTRKYRNHPQHPFQEVLGMSLNEQSTLPAYVLGRLFAVLEKVQQEAIGSMNASIKDRYFTSACATPRLVFPVLLRLSQHHIAKAEYGRSSDRRIQDLLNLLDIENNPFPAHLSLDEQGLFILGYYQQRAAFYAKGQTSTTEATSEEDN